MELKVSRFEKSSKAIDTFLENLKYYQTDADIAEITFEELQMIVPRCMETVVVGEILNVCDPEEVNYPQRFFVVFAERQLFSAVITIKEKTYDIKLSAECNKNWVFEHSINRIDLEVDEVVRSAVNFYAQSYRRVNEKKEV